MSAETDAVEAAIERGMVKAKALEGYRLTLETTFDQLVATVGVKGMETVLAGVLTRVRQKHKGRS